MERQYYDIEIVIAQPVLKLTQVSKVPLSTGSGSLEDRRLQFRLSCALVFTTLYNLQHSENGFFMRLLGGPVVLPWEAPLTQVNTVNVVKPIESSKRSRDDVSEGEISEDEGELQGKKKKLTSTKGNTWREKHAKQAAEQSATRAGDKQEAGVTSTNDLPTTLAVDASAAVDDTLGLYDLGENGYSLTTGIQTDDRVAEMCATIADLRKRLKRQGQKVRAAEARVSEVEEKQEQKHESIRVWLGVARSQLKEMRKGWVAATDRTRRKDEIVEEGKDALVGCDGLIALVDGQIKEFGGEPNETT